MLETTPTTIAGIILVMALEGLKISTTTTSPFAATTDISVLPSTGRQLQLVSLLVKQNLLPFYPRLVSNHPMVLCRQAHMNLGKAN